MKKIIPKLLFLIIIITSCINQQNNTLEGNEYLALYKAKEVALLNKDYGITVPLHRSHDGDTAAMAVGRLRRKSDGAAHFHDQRRGAGQRVRQPEIRRARSGESRRDGQSRDWH